MNAVRVFLSPSSQIYNSVHGGGHEQQYARARCERAAEILRSHGVEVRVSPVVNDDRNGYARSVTEGNAWGATLYVADHTNATGNPGVVASGVHHYCWLPDAASVALGKALGRRMDQIIGGTHQIRDGSHLYEVNGPKCTAVLTENGFHDNPRDAAIIRTRTREMGEALAYGILDHLGIPVRTETTKSAPAPATPKPKPEPPTIEEIIAMNSGITWQEGNTHHYLLFNTFSGWMQEYNNGGGGPLGGSYNNPIAAALRTGSFATVSPSHARAIKASLLALRAGKVEVSGTVAVIEGGQQ